MVRVCAYWDEKQIVQKKGISWPTEWVLDSLQNK
jgi:hypothetical protein